MRFLLPVLLIGLTFFALPAVSSSASNIPTAITNIKIDEASAGRWFAITVDISFSIPATAKPGDSFSAVLPPSLIARNETFDVLAPDGSLVAVAVVEHGVITFTLTNYVATHEHVTGSAQAKAHFKQDQITPGQDNNFDFHSGTTHWQSTVNIAGPISADHSKAYKIGFWTDGEDQGAHGADGAVSWRVYSKAGPWNSLVFHDALGPGQVNDCSSITVDSATTYRADGSLIHPVPLGSRATVTCRAATFDVTIATVHPAEVVRVSYTTTITNQALAPFSNAVDVVSNGRTVPLKWTVSHYGALGSASGVVPSTTPPTTAPSTSARTTTAATTPATLSAEATTVARTTSLPVTATTGPTLPFTGSRTSGLAETGGLLLLVGGGLVLLGRRRRGLHEG